MLSNSAGEDFADIGARFAARGGFDLALIAIGAYAPRWFMQSQHVEPAEAVQIHHDVGARRSMGIHWGTFELTDEALDEPPERLAQERRDQGLADEDFFVLAVGQTRRITPRVKPRNWPAARERRRRARARIRPAAARSAHAATGSRAPS